MHARVVHWARSGPAGVPAEDGIELALQPVPVARVEGELVPGPMKGELGAVGPEQLCCPIVGKMSDAFLRQDPHVNLETEQSENGEREDRENDDISKVLHRLDDSADNRFQT